MPNPMIHEFNPVIYPYRVWVIIDRTPAVIQEQFDGYDRSPIKNLVDDTKNLEAFAMPGSYKESSNYGVIIYFRSKKSMTYELVAHESSHAAKYLFDHIGADIKEHEPFEYVIGWIAGCCEKAKKHIPAK